MLEKSDSLDIVIQVCEDSHVLVCVLSSLGSCSAPTSTTVSSSFNSTSISPSNTNGEGHTAMYGSLLHMPDLALMHSGTHTLYIPMRCLVLQINHSLPQFPEREKHVVINVVRGLQLWQQ